MRIRHNRLLISWTVHFLILWTGIIAFSLVPYLYHVYRSGNYLFHADGSPLTGWQYFITVSTQDGWIIALFILLVEINYQYLLKKIHIQFFIGSSLIIGFVSYTIFLFLNPLRVTQQGILAAVEPVLLMGAYAFFYSLIRDYFRQLLHQKDIRIQQSENELKALKAQLNPHFLFNSLNYLYGTALKEKALQTAEGIDRLSEMLRYTITGIEENYVPLEKEIRFIEHYISLQKARTSLGNIQADIKVRPDHQGLMIAPLLLLPFIENAFKFGISIDHPHPITIRVIIEKQTLTMEVSNGIMANRNEVKGNNTGIKNTVKRLNLLYPDNYKLEYKDTGTTYKTRLYLHLNNPL